MKNHKFVGLVAGRRSPHASRFMESISLHHFVLVEFFEFATQRFGARAVRRFRPGRCAAAGVSEFVLAVCKVARANDADPAELFASFGEWLFPRLARLLPVFFAGARSVFDLLAQAERWLSVDLPAFYPQDTLPEISCVRLGRDEYRVDYSSQLQFSDLAEGLLRGCVAYFGETVTVEREDVWGYRPGVRFTLRHAGGLAADSNEICRRKDPEPETTMTQCAEAGRPRTRDLFRPFHG